MGIGILAFIFYPELKTVVLERLEDLVRDVLGEDKIKTGWTAAAAIFKNNLLAASLVLFGGVFFAIVPLFSIAINFFLLGFLSALLWASFGLFITSILPHGILEIPALLIAAAFGLKFGLFWIRPIKTEGIWKNFILGGKDVLRIFPLLIFMLVLAAFIEVFVTTWFIALLSK